jgi:hypothetical protein
LPIWARRCSAARRPSSEFIVEETEKWAKVIKFAGIKAE